MNFPFDGNLRVSIVMGVPKRPFRIVPRPKVSRRFLARSLHGLPVARTAADGREGGTDGWMDGYTGIIIPYIQLHVYMVIQLHVYISLCMDGI